MARLTSDIFVSALLRNCFNAGDFASILNKGASEAGAIFIIWRQNFEDLHLLGPAPQALYRDPQDAPDRQFEVLLTSTTQEAIDGRMAAERRFDPDIWLVEIECRELPGAILCTPGI